MQTASREALAAAILFRIEKYYSVEKAGLDVEGELCSAPRDLTRLRSQPQR